MYPRYVVWRCRKYGRRFTQNGFDIWVYDYRGFGKSDDFKINVDQLYYTEFVNDLSAVVDSAMAARPKNKIGLYGFSMGTIISTLYNLSTLIKLTFTLPKGLSAHRKRLSAGEKQHPTESYSCPIRILV
jgi:predicted alpha/beta hydrolase